MPIVFVHGVNNRQEDAGFASCQSQIETYLKNIFAPRVGLDSSLVSVFFPYWGGHGVKFRWNQASLPLSSDAVESFTLNALGPDSSDLEMWIGEARYQHGPIVVSLGQVSRTKGFEAAIDLVWDTASAVAQQSNGYEDVVEGYAASIAFAKAQPAPLWALQGQPLTNEAFVLKLLQEIEPYRPSKSGEAHESLGLSDWFQSLKEAVSRLGSAPTDAATSLLVGLGRKSVHEKATRFLGDIFVYLSERGTVDALGAIVKDVLNELILANAARKPGDDKLIVIGHSLGGVIVYDILTYFKPDLKVDVFASVGSQVAVFEEMTLYRASKLGVPPNPPADRLASRKASGSG
ncbi:MAG: hypothetical protein V5B44_04285 [Candidatus Accumulibacter necessarius]|jgi:hypothetical protein|uniref:hypothetical protein n=1 Tax=Candidatus Accumulibacter necessarius TaxID=2954386 RepID=UPI002FC3410B